MARDEPPRFRITAWPGRRVEEPMVLAGPVERQGDWIGIDLTHSRRVGVPDGVYLKEIRDADARSADDLARLAELGIWIPIGPPRDLIADTRHWPSMFKRFQAELNARKPLQDLESERERLLIATGRIPTHLDEIAFRVRVLQRAVHHVIAWRNGDSPASAWRDCDSDVAAWSIFTDRSNLALRDYHVRIYVDRPEGNIGDVYPTVYSVAWLQLVNDLAEDAPYRTCANGTCGGLFVRQRGRALETSIAPRV